MMSAAIALDGNSRFQGGVDLMGQNNQGMPASRITGISRCADSNPRCNQGESANQGGNEAEVKGAHDFASP